MKDKLATGVAWLGSAKLVINLLALSSTIILARLLTPGDFGLVAIVLALLAIIESVTDLSLAASLIHHHKPTELHYHTAWSLGLVRGAVLALIFALIAPFVSDFYHDSRLTPVMWTIAVSIFISGFKNPKVVILTRELIFWQEFVMSVSQKVLGFTVGVLCAWYLKSYWALVAGTVASQVTGTIVTFIVVRYRPKLSFKHVREIWSFSIWLTLGKIINTLNWKFDHLLIGSYLGQKTLGIYSVGDNLAGLPTREAIQPLESTLFPGFRTIANDPSRLRAAYTSAQSLITTLALPLGVGFALISHSLVLLLMGEKWLPIIDVIQVISCVYVLQTMGSQVHPLAMALGKTKTLFNRDLFSFVIRIPLIVAGLYLGGLMGVVLARTVSGGITLIINMHLIGRMLSISFLSQLRANIRSLVSVIVMAISVKSIQWWIGVDGSSVELVIKLIYFILCGALSYSVTHWILWTVMGKPMGSEVELLKLTKLFMNKILLKFNRD